MRLFCIPATLASIGPRSPRRCATGLIRPERNLTVWASAASADQIPEHFDRTGLTCRTVTTARGVRAGRNSCSRRLSLRGRRACPGSVHLMNSALFRLRADHLRRFFRCMRMASGEMSISRAPDFAEAARQVAGPRGRHAATQLLALPRCAGEVTGGPARSAPRMPPPTARAGVGEAATCRCAV